MGVKPTFNMLRGPNEILFWIQKYFFRLWDTRCMQWLCLQGSNRERNPRSRCCWINLEQRSSFEFRIFFQRLWCSRWMLRSCLPRRGFYAIRYLETGRSMNWIFRVTDDWFEKKKQFRADGIMSFRFFRNPRSSNKNIQGPAASPAKTFLAFRKTGCGASLRLAAPRLVWPHQLKRTGAMPWRKRAANVNALGVATSKVQCSDANAPRTRTRSVWPGIHCVHDAKKNLHDNNWKTNDN